MAKSEIAQLRKRIEEEYTAAQRALHSPAMVAKHEFITARMEGIHCAHEELKRIVGEEEAIQLVVCILLQSPQASQERTIVAATSQQGKDAPQT